MNLIVVLNKTELKSSVAQHLIEVVSILLKNLDEESRENLVGFVESKFF
jgi:hypothetical protein